MPRPLTTQLTDTTDLDAYLTHIATSKGVTIDPLLRHLLTTTYDQAKQRGDTTTLTALDPLIGATLDTRISNPAILLRISAATAATHTAHLRTLDDDTFTDLATRTGATAHTAKSTKEASTALDATLNLLDAPATDRDAPAAALTAAIAAMEPTGREQPTVSAPTRSPLHMAPHAVATTTLTHHHTPLKRTQLEAHLNTMIATTIGDGTPHLTVLTAALDAYDKATRRTRPTLANSDLVAYLGDYRKHN